MERRKWITLLMIILVCFLASCMKRETEDTLPAELSLGVISGSYEKEDLTDLGLWLLTINGEALSNRIREADAYYLKTDGGIYRVRRNPLNARQLMVFLPETFAAESLKTAKLVTQGPGAAAGGRNEADIFIESVYLTKAGTVYELTLTDYLFMKQAPDAFVYEDGKLLRPTHVKSSDGYAYLMKYYYDARQATSEHSVNGAFNFLKDLGTHENYIDAENPHRVKIEDGHPVTDDPDTRDRVWQLGAMGTIDETATYTYDVTTDSEAQKLILTLKEENLPVKYKQSGIYEIQLRDDATVCCLYEIAPGIYQGDIQYRTTNNIDLVKNARFNETPLITLYSSTGDVKAMYTTMSEAVGAAEDGDVIKAGADVLLSESKQCYLSDKELTITSESGMFTLDYTDAATRAFYLTGTASLTIENAIIQNISFTEYTGGGAFLIPSVGTPNLTIRTTVIGTNTIPFDGAGIAAYAGKILVENSTLTNNRDGANGGAVYNYSHDFTIRNSYLSGNHSTTKGGGVYNAGTLYFYDNTLDANTAVLGGKGVFIQANAKVYNSDGELWRHFNVPYAGIQTVESRETAENRYTGHGNEEGADILRQYAVETAVGTLTLSPSTATENERKLIEINCEIGTYFDGGSLTIITPVGFDLSDTASVTIGTAPAVSTSVFEKTANSLTITGITGATGTVVKLSLMETIPSGSAIQARNKGYTFRVKTDADGMGSAQDPSTEEAAVFTSEREIEDGSEDHPFKISTVEQLAKVGTGTDGWTLEKSYKLMNDLDFNDDSCYENAAVNKSTYTTGTGWDPIGSSTFIPSSGFNGSCYFKGLFDGNGFTIKNLYINRDEQYGCMGLFAGVGDTGYHPVIKDLTLEQGNISCVNQMYIGALTGWVFSDPLFENCSVKNVTVTGNSNTGSLIGYIKGSPEIIGCSAINVSVSGHAGVGALIGNCVGEEGNLVTIKYSFANGSVTANSINYGGFCGGITYTTVRGCYSSVGVTHTETYKSSDGSAFSGFVNFSTIQDCYSTGSVHGNKDADGGIAGIIKNSTISNTYATGDLTIAGPDNIVKVGGLLGLLDNTSVSNSIAFNGTVVAGDNSDDVAGKASTNRVAGELINGSTLSGCYANETMVVKYEGVNETFNKGTTTVDGADIANLTSTGTAPMTSWDFDTDTNGDHIYWKLEAGANRPVLYVDPEGDGSFVKLGTDDGM